MVEVTIPWAATAQQDSYTVQRQKCQGFLRIPLGMVTDVSPWHLLKSKWSIERTPLGIVTNMSPVHPSIVQKLH